MKTKNSLHTFRTLSIILSFIVLLVQCKKDDGPNPIVDEGGIITLKLSFGADWENQNPDFFMQPLPLTLDSSLDNLNVMHQETGQIYRHDDFNIALNTATETSFTFITEADCKALMGYYINANNVSDFPAEGLHIDIELFLDGVKQYSQDYHIVEILDSPTYQWSIDNGLEEN